MPARLLYHEDYLVTLRLDVREGDRVPPAVCLRSALKTLLRAYGVRCRRIEALAVPPPPCPAEARAAAGPVPGTVPG